MWSNYYDHEEAASELAGEVAGDREGHRTVYSWHQAHCHIKRYSVQALPAWLSILTVELNVAVIVFLLQ